MNRKLVTIVTVLVFLALLGWSERANAQLIYRGWWYPPVYYPPLHIIWYPRPPVVRRPLFPVRFPIIYLPEREGRDERRGEEEIRRFLLSQKVKFRMHRPLTIISRRGEFHLERDFDLSGGVTLEYWSQGDEQYQKEEFRRFRQAVGGDPNMIKPVFFFNKREVYQEYQRGEVYFIEPQDIEDIYSLEQKLRPILKELTKKQILSEKEAVRFISIYLRRKEIPYQKDTTFKIDELSITPDFLVEIEGRKPLVIEYLIPAERKKKRNYEEYRKAGGIVWLIEPGTRREILADLRELID